MGIFSSQFPVENENEFFILLLVPSDDLSGIMRIGEKPKETHYFMQQNTVK